MDKMYFWLSKLADWISVNPLPPIPYADFSSSPRIYNPPAEHLEISFMTSGGCDDLKIGNKIVSLGTNEVSLRNVHFGNYSSSSKNAQSWCVFFDVKGIREFEEMKRDPFFVSMPVSHPDRLVLAFKTLAYRCRLPGMIHPGYLSGTYAYAPNDKRHCSRVRQLYIKSALLEMLAVLMENASAIRTGCPADQLQIIRLAIEFITRHYSRSKLSLSDLAGAVHLSEGYFGQLFRRHVNVSPMRYLRTVRMEQSKLLLSQTYLSIGEIAVRVGFDDPLHFSRLFHRHVGDSPREFRRKIRESL